MSPGMVWVGASGRQLTREEYVEFTWRRYASGHHGDDHTWEVTEFEVEELAPNLWAARYLLRQGERTTRRLTLWEHHDGLWRARYHQGTVMDSAP